MKKLTYYRQKKIKQNLDYYFNLATEKEIKDGKNWYKDANNFCKDAAKKFNYNVYTVASILSALSPRNKWEQNKKDCLKVLKAVNGGLNPEQIKVCTFNTNKFKAFNIAKNKVSLNNTSLKTFNFLNNIAFLCPESVTVDIWHLRACFNKSIKINNAAIGKIAYKQIKDITLLKAKKYDLKAYELQAILWLTVQKHYNNK